MKRFTTLLLLMCSICATSCNKQTSSYEEFNQDWSFTMGDMDSQYFQKDLDDKDWDTVDIPHDWSIIEGYTQEHTAGSNGFLPGGIGWYRKSFDVPSSLMDKNIAVRFEAIYNNSQVWINGHDLGFFPNGYLDIEYDLTPYIVEGENVIAVRVDRRAYADARWYVGAGIYRPAHLIVREDVYIPTHGVMITAPQISSDKATVNVTSDITNVAKEDQSVVVEYQVKFNGENVASNSEDVTAKSGDTTINNSIEVASPKLWSMENPNMYDLYTTIKQGDVILNESHERFGIKSMEFDPEQGFLLNGKSEKIKGVNIHHDLGCVGVALHDNVLYRRLKKLQDMGVNAIRTAHNPHSESMMAMCDTMGLLVMNEFVDEWRVWKAKWIEQRSKSDIADSLEAGYSQYFDQVAERDLKNFIRRDYNHPSIILWSIGNEIEWTYPYYFASSIDRKGYTGLVFTGQPEKNKELTAKRFAEMSGGKDELAETAHLLAKWVKDVDTTRPVTSGVVIPSVARISGYTDALDVVGYNYKDAYYEVDHQMYPEKSIIGSENVGQYFEWKAVADKPYIPGIFLWTGVDYIGENGPWPAKCGTYSLFDVAGFKTARGHFFETLWLDAPKTHIVTTPASISEFKLQDDGSFITEFRKDPLRKWLWFETFDKWNYNNDEEIVVQIYTNAPKAELRLNGESLGVKSRADFAEENIILWQVPYKAGELTAIGLDEDGKEVSKYTINTYGKTTSLACNADAQQVKSNGIDLAHIEIELRDENGNLVSDTPEQITVTCDSKSKILGIDNGSDTFVGDHQANTIETNNGHALIIIQPIRGAKGSSKVKISTDNGVESIVDLEYL